MTTIWTTRPFAKWLIPFIALGACGCSQRYSDDVERSAAPPALLAPSMAAAPKAGPSTAPARAAPVIVRLVGREMVVTATSGPDGPRFSASNPRGDVLVAGATLGELRASHPEVYRFIFPSSATKSVARTPTSTARPEVADVDLRPLAWAGQ